MRAEAISPPQRWPQSWRKTVRLPRSSRAIAFLLVLFIHALIAVVLLTITPRAKLAKMGRNAMETFNILSPQPEQAETPPAPAPAPAEPSPTPKPKPSQPASPPTIDAPAPPVDLGVMKLDLDIRKLPNRREEAEQAAKADAALPDSRIVSAPAVYGPTYGPSQNRPSSLAGKTLYAAEWFREPTDAELAFYLPKTGVPAGSWALVACRTVIGFRVEDCQEMGDSRPGSGLSRAIRNAAWQFRVRPPRVGGEYKVGEWVQIRIDFTGPPPREAVERYGPIP
jgi:protein TonB